MFLDKEQSSSCQFVVVKWLCVSIFAEDVMPAKGTSISTLDGPDRMTHLGGFISVISYLLLFQISCLWVQGLEKH
jgi:hypothetical protein